MESDSTEKPLSPIAIQNDEYRRCRGEPDQTDLRGNVLITRSVDALPDDEQKRVLDAVKSFDSFSIENDPYLEHDFGLVLSNTYYFKFDYFSNDEFEHGSDNPADPTRTHRLLTIARLDEY